ncbi:MAG: hypothetical protein CMB99_06715 [Flavobacteriaceae bacterium]|nr:hypothetical protein [Flavobacteriaceae bacterium]|tara:strand:+ start:90350 stop:91192 length:843 start_codon:yes stop_codon:yes gene_type:complete
MATKKATTDQKLGKAKAIVKKINNDLIDASFNAIETTVKTGEKWQKLTKKLIKKAEPLTQQQINMMVETAESIKGQVETGTERLKHLVGYDPKMVDNAKKMVSEHPVVEKAEEIKDKVEKEIANNKLVQKAEKMSENIKKNISETIEEVKGKIDQYTDGILDGEEKGKTKKTKKTTAKKTTKKTVKKEAVKKEGPIVIEKVDTKDDLKVIKGIGPVLEKSLNQLNITSFGQIAKMTIKDLTKVLTDAGINAKIYDLSGWKAQAKLALKGDMEAVKNWTKK